MSITTALDPDLLRAFVLIAEGRSFTDAASLLGRTQSAVSMQIKRLEEILGQPVLSRSRGAGVELTPHGQYLLERAREILSLNDEVVANFHAPAMSGSVRLGTPDDYALRYLPEILARFAQTHPAVEVSVVCLPSLELVKLLRNDELDLTLCSDGNQPRGWPQTPLWRGRLIWVTSTRHAPHRLTPLPLALADAARTDCSWRNAAEAALRRARINYRVAYTSASQVGTLVPVMAGLAVTVCASSWLPDGLRPLRLEEGMPQLPEYSIVLLKGRRAPQPVTDALAAQIEDSFRDRAVPLARAAGF